MPANNLLHESPHLRHSHAFRNDLCERSGPATAQKDSFAESRDTTLTTKLDIAEIKSEIKLLKWMIGLVLAGIALLILKAFFT